MYAEQNRERSEAHKMGEGHAGYEAEVWLQHDTLIRQTVGRLHLGKLFNFLNSFLLDQILPQEHVLISAYRQQMVEHKYVCP